MYYKVLEDFKWNIKSWSILLRKDMIFEIKIKGFKKQLKLLERVGLIEPVENKKLKPIIMIYK